MANNFFASTLWRRFSVLKPPAGLVQEVQRMLVTFFWSGQHWIRSAVLYLPVQEGGQGLVDIRSRIMAFRLQAAQRLLFHGAIAWKNTATVLLRRAGGMGFDKHLFLMTMPEAVLAGLTPFYRSMLEAWKVFSASRTADTPVGMWLFEEPLFFNPFLPSALLSSAVLRSRLVATGYTKLGHLMSTGTAAVSERTGIRSGRLLDQVMAEVQRSLPADYLSFLNDPSVIAQWREGCQYDFPELTVSPAVEWTEDERHLLFHHSILHSQKKMVLQGFFSKDNGSI